MTRHDIIERIGSSYVTSNIEGGEFSYVKAAGSKNRLRTAVGHPITHFKLDIRFVFQDMVILVETKQNFVDADVSQLSEYYEEEVALYGTRKVICILANTNNDDIRVWKNGVDATCILSGETVLDTMAHYVSLFVTSVQNDRETVLRNTYALNEFLHKNDIDESLRSQFVGTTLLYIKKIVKQRGNPDIDESFRNTLKSFWNTSGAAPIRAAIEETLNELLDGSENKAKKIELLQNNVLNCISCRRIDRMCDISIFAIRSFFAGHCNEESFLAINYFDVMYNKNIIQCDGNNRLHLAFLCNLTYMYVSNVHLTFPLNLYPWALIKVHNGHYVPQQP